MTNMIKKELTNITKRHYLKADKKSKTLILNEFCKNTRYNRKYAVGILQAGYDNEKVIKYGRKPRSKIYNSDVMLAAIKIWELLDYPCGARLKPVLSETVKSLERFKEISVSKKVKKQLAKISARTLDRRLEKEREAKHLLRNRGTTKHGSLLKSSIPIRITDWDTSDIGWLEMDTVAHNGGDPNGTFIYSLDLLEIASGWSEQRAVFGKGEQGVVKAIDNIKNKVPFSIKGFDSDTGSEFVNWHLVRYCEHEHIGFTRSRPMMKNDNAYVEQKNNTHIRKRLGYRRYDSEKQLNMINDLYQNELSLFNNFFNPVMKIKSKEKVNNSVCRKKYDTALPPYLRLMKSKQITRAKKKELETLYLTLNLVQLKKIINAKIKKIRNS